MNLFHVVVVQPHNFVDGDFIGKIHQTSWVLNNDLI
jgi:hypothetical protein